MKRIQYEPSPASGVQTCHVQIPDLLSAAEHMVAVELQLHTMTSSQQAAGLRRGGGGRSAF